MPFPEHPPQLACRTPQNRPQPLLARMQSFPTHLLTNAGHPPLLAIDHLRIMRADGRPEVAVVVAQVAILDRLGNEFRPNPSLLRLFRFQSCVVMAIPLRTYLPRVAASPTGRARRLFDVLRAKMGWGSFRVSS